MYPLHSERALLIDLFIDEHDVTLLSAFPFDPLNLHGIYFVTVTIHVFILKYKIKWS